MARIRLTDRFVASADAAGTIQADYFDEVTKGLVLRVARTGRRVWTYVYTSPRDGKRARLGLGQYPAVTLSAARGRAIEAATQVAAGQDPRAARSAQASAAMTVAGLINAYLADPEKAKLRSIEEIERRLRKNVAPAIGSVLLSEVRRRDLRNVTDVIMRRGKSTEAARVFEDARAMFRWAVDREYVEHSPADGMAKPAAGGPRERVLSDVEIATLWRGLPMALPRSKQCQRIIRLCLITGQRVGEVAGMARQELDLPALEWRLPGARTKNGHPHTVPLVDMAVTIIDEALAEAGGSGLLFPCNATHLSGHAVARTILRANEPDEERPLGRFGIAPWSAHDLRRTCLTGMARLGIAPHVIGAVANHRSVTKATVTMAHYVTHRYDAEKRQASQLWADRLAVIVGGAPAAVVLPMARA